ncbi:hypothetical protein Xmau_04309 [Xenorhabdus mauleonii]|uniref:Uncharacterized protein n=1 Tax=Xenorhabdus mauleonii TaxID=351675 RepID=A0A1I3XRG6_9GAMM|nr:hypothetical protein [Xenorhabdus mauleonii]PHM36300.1 hypothetical protein Xmau_04309 [Xenorhabdus mauleonii]SFK22124.1 hypothetical protein SAMN05421680_1381 [Xenorhabdus mauleonii]
MQIKINRPATLQINPPDIFSTEYPLVKSNRIVRLDAYTDYLITSEYLIQDNPMNPTTLLIRASCIHDLLYRSIVNYFNVRDVLKSLGFIQVNSSSNGVKFKLDRAKYPTVRTIRAFRQQVLSNFTM